MAGTIYRGAPRSGWRALVALPLLVVTVSLVLITQPAAAAITGGDWSDVTVPAAGYNYGLTSTLRAFTSCAPGTTFCMSVVDDSSVTLDTVGWIGQGVLVTLDGVSWNSYTSLPSTQQVMALSCPAVDVCFALGSVVSPEGDLGSPVVIETTDGGQSWQVLSYPDRAVPYGNGIEPWTASAMDCPTTADCFMVGGTYSSSSIAPGAPPLYVGVVASSVDGAKTWSETALTQAVPLHNWALSSISCETAESCVAVGASGSVFPGVALSTTDGGTTWLSSPDPNLAGVDLYEVSCAGLEAGLPVCTALGGASLNGAGPIELRSTDGGVTWSGEQFTDIPAPAGLYGLSCPTAKVCWTTNATESGADALYGTADGGSEWYAIARDDEAGGAGSIACASETLCVATVDGGLWVTTDGGGVVSATGQPSIVTPIPPDSPSVVSQMATRAVVVGGKDLAAAEGTTVIVTVAEPAHAQISQSTSVGLNGYYAAKISKVVLGASKVAFSIGNKTVRSLTVNGYAAPPPVVTGICLNVEPLSGNRRVTILGRNMRGVTSVKFGAASASVIRWVSPRKIIVEAPVGHDKSVLVTVTTSAGGPSALTAHARYTYR